ncbi:MAG: TonB-dependent receptor [Flavobacteriaceae bacterium]|nr:TonB-dependent receptor [Flavobacteriaceae bacterium]|tara:strand:+ start:32078 stop:35188 length:3111 start_codon:yes stop_codon:yes gene_type:complete
MKTSFIKTFLSLTFCLLANLVIAQSTITGTIQDENSDPIPGVNIVIEGTSEGVVSDFDGNFTITTNQALPFNITVSSVGFSSQTIEVTNAEQSISVSLASGTRLDEVIISASRKREKVQEAPASVTLITARDIENSPYVNDPVTQLVNVPGVQIQQQSAQTINIEMRAGSGVFGTSTFPILDYRYLVTPAAGSFLTYQSGMSNLDIAQIEVVRGAASALYGPGVTSGVVHFITKNPIDYPGTAVEMFGGTQSTYGGAVRYAQANSGKTFGFKINARFARGDEFELDQYEDQDIIDTFSTTISQPAITNQMVDATQPGTVLLDRSDLDPDGDNNMLASEYQNYAVNAHLEFRPSTNTQAFLSGGLNNGGGLFFNSQGHGFTQGNDYWTQARIQSGGFFAQAYWNHNDGGDAENPTFLYASGFRQVAERTSLEAQLQYNFDVSALNTEITVGMDYRDTASNSDYTLFGRNDDDDPYTITGVYGQGTTVLNDQVDLTYAMRYDQFNLVDEGAWAPRIALVYKVDERNTFRVSYNVATFGPSALEAYIDFPVNTIAPGILDIWLAGQVSPQTFAAPEAQMMELAALGISIPAATPGLPLNIVYQAVSSLSTPGAIALLPGYGLGDFAPILQGVMDAYPGPQGMTGQFIGSNLFNGDSMAFATDTPQASIGTLSSWEVGYKGLIADKWAIGLDIYSYNRKGFTQFTALAPSYALVGFDPQDLGDEVGAYVAGAVQDPVTAAVTPLVQAGIEAATLDAVTGGVTQAYQDAANLLAGAGIDFATLSANGLDVATAAAISAAVGFTVDPMPDLATAIAGTYATSIGPALAANLDSAVGAQVAQIVGGLSGIAGGAYVAGAEGFQGQAGQLFPVLGTVESNRTPQGDGMTHIPAGYRRFGDSERSHYGADLAVEYFASKNLSLWGNASWLSQNVWTPGQYGDDGLQFSSFLNAPMWKYRLGMKYTGQNGFRTSVSFQHDDSFDSNQGMFSGVVQEKNLFDVSVGRKFGKIQVDLAGRNIFDQKYRAFPGMPIIGRQVLLKANFNF